MKAGVEMRYKHAMILINGQSPAQILQERITKEGTQANGTTLRLHSFINHQVDCHLMSICGQHLAYRFRGLGANKIIAPRSGSLPPRPAPSSQAATKLLPPSPCALY